MQTIQPWEGEDEGESRGNDVEGCTYKGTKAKQSPPEILPSTFSPKLEIGLSAATG